MDDDPTQIVIKDEAKNSSGFYGQKSFPIFQL
jgi:hypothetical protein